MSRPPNFLIFMTDQQRGDTAPPVLRAPAPNLARFAGEGIAFSRAYCPSPHCCPSRASFFSGLFPSEHGVWNNVDVGNALSRGLYDGVRLFSEDLRDAGYDLHYSGKWHVSALETPVDRGWRMTRPPKPVMTREEAGRPRPFEWKQYEKLPPTPRTRGDGEILRPGYGTYTHYGERENPFGDEEVVADGASVLRERKKGGDPWCQFIGPVGPHDPYFVPPRFLDLIDPKSIELPASFADAMADKPALYRKTRSRFDQLTPREHREAIRHYLAFCAYEDHLFGEVLRALAESGQEEETVVLYLSDHGDYMAEHGLWCKGLPSFRSAYHIPALLRHPGKIRDPGRVVDRFVSLADFAPTILELADLPRARRFAGESLVPFLEGRPSPRWRDAWFTQSNGNELYGIQRTVTTEKWRYVYNGFDEDELYDLEADPGECRNLARDPACAPVIKACSKRLWTFAHENQDTCVNRYIMVAHAPMGPGLAFGEA
ncbi:MAG: sulfatase-like hydrolase/transferase [Spirochaetes bacterium]|nr:sulfatase-like hydrolase/transferase [Spirochaetota bacterium]